MQSNHCRGQQNTAAIGNKNQAAQSRTRVYVCPSCIRCLKAPPRGPTPKACKDCYRHSGGRLFDSYKCKDCGGSFARDFSTGRIRVRCKSCRKDFEAKQEKSRRAALPSVPRNCVVCKQSFLARDRRAKYCSQKCVGSLRAKPPPACRSCGGPVGYRKSKECWNCYQGKLQKLFIKIKCKHCGQTAKKRRWNSLTPKYCSRECFYESVRVPKTPEERKSARDYARNRGGTTHRKRCRKFGCFYNAKVTRLAVLDACSWRCYICGHKVSDDVAATHDRKATIDHVVPLEKGGPHDWHNVKACCRRCNTKKQAQWDGQNVFNFSSGWEYVNG